MHKISVIGSGVVGRASGLGFLNKGNRVTFFDVNPNVLKSLHEEGLEAFHPSQLSEHPSDAYMFSVDTPTIGGRLHLEHLRGALEDFARTALRNATKYCLVVIRSTVPPGTTEGSFIPLLEHHSGKRAGTDFGVCMNPEFLREKTAEEDFKHPWIIVVGSLDERSASLMHTLNKPYDCPYEQVSLKEAEMEKYVHNLFNACKISFFNEMRLVCEEMKIDADRVFSLVAKSAEGMWNPSYGTLDAGPFDGMCLPKDTSAFLYWARHSLRHPLPLLRAEIEVNEIMKNPWTRGKRFCRKLLKRMRIPKRMKAE
ncbi:MAG: hypothetical protein PHW10_00745 [Candidatus Peribacteraceae bacterium]|nr:hypothetical protein [Candidatus Peribacteraceae bacterium]